MTINRNAFLSLAAVSTLALTSVACESGKQPETPQTVQVTAAAPPSSSGAFTVGDTFGVLTAIHAAEVEHGTLAMQKANDPKVKDFAEKVVNDHKARMEKDSRLMSGLGVSPRDSSVSTQIKSAADQQTQRLNGMSGSDFDRAYIEEQINYYRSALDVFDRDLLPNAKDPQIRADIQDARGRANDHLKEAQDLRLSLINK